MYNIVIFLTLGSLAHCFNPEVDEQFHKLPHDEFITYFNKLNFSWTITKYDNIDDKVLDCVEVRNISIPTKISEKNKIFLHKEFDSRTKWPYCTEHFSPRDQGKCASCWAVTTSAVAGARSCIRNYFYSITFPELSAMDMTCCTDCFSKDFCSGGSPERAVLFWIKNGLVTNQCKPYNLNDTTCIEECGVEERPYNVNKYFAYTAHIVPADDVQLRLELATSGPLIATFALFEDLKDYKSGIYEHTHGDLVGHHSVQVIGFGEENKVPYWLVSNTWGSEWGQNGTFKIKRFQRLLNFESQMISVFSASRFSP